MHKYNRLHVVIILLHLSRAYSAHWNFLRVEPTTLPVQAGGIGRPHETRPRCCQCPLHPWGTGPVPHDWGRTRAAQVAPCTRAQQPLWRALLGRACQRPVRARAGASSAAGGAVGVPHTPHTRPRRAPPPPKAARAVERRQGAKAAPERRQHRVSMRHEKACGAGFEGRRAAAYLRRAREGGHETAQGARPVDWAPGRRATRNSGCQPAHMMGKPAASVEGHTV